MEEYRVSVPASYRLESRSKVCSASCGGSPACLKKLSPARQGFCMAGWPNWNPPCSGYFVFLFLFFSASLPKVMSVIIEFLVLLKVGLWIFRQFCNVTLAIFLALALLRQCQRSTTRMTISITHSCKLNFVHTLHLCRSFNELPCALGRWA